MEDTTIEDVLKTVETLYVNKEYQKALEILNANKKNISSPVWHYNVGTFYGKLENWPLARYHLTIAEWEGLRSKEVSLNKHLVESKLEIAKLERPTSLQDYFVKGGIEASQGILSLISFIFVFIGLIFFWRQKIQKIFLACLAMGSIALGMNLWIHSWDKMIVINSQTIKDGPSEIFGQHDEVPTGVMIVGKSKGDWIEIIYPSRFQGWIKNTGLKELK